MDKNVCDNTLVFGSCYARSCIEVPSLKAGKAKWKAFYDKFPWLKGQPFYLRRSSFWDGGERNLRIFSQQTGRRCKDEEENIDPHSQQAVVRYDCGWRENRRIS